MAKRAQGPLWLRWVLAAVMIGLFFLTRYYLPREDERPKPEPQPPVAEAPVEKETPVAEPPVEKDPPAEKEEEQPRRPPSNKTFVDGTLARNVTVRDFGKTVFRGDIELKPTLDRIAAKKRLDRFSHDGTTFQNREELLPRKPAGYYHEWVHPTPKIDGPGPQRIVSGADGDLWYTPDHYERFFRINAP